MCLVVLLLPASAERKIQSKALHSISCGVVPTALALAQFCVTFQVTERFNKFLERYEHHVLADPLSGPVRLLFVVFRPDDGQSMFKDDSVSHVVTVLDEFKQRNPQANVEYIFVKGEFSRAVGIHSGVLHVSVILLVSCFGIFLWLRKEHLVFRAVTADVTVHIYHRCTTSTATKRGHQWSKTCYLRGR